MPVQSHPFTSSEEISNFEPGDTAVVLCGYIDKIEGLKLVSGGTKTLLKFVVNNGDDVRIRVLMWDVVAKANSHKLSHHQKIYITMGSITPAHPGYLGSEDVVKVEFNVQEASTVKYLGILEGAGVITPENFPEIPMESLLQNQGSPVSVIGYIKTPFVTVTHHSASFGGGCVVFLKHRLSVQITNFKEQNELEVGKGIKLMGRLKSRVSKTIKNQTEYFFEVPDMKHIIMLENKTATEEEMASAVISATAKRYSSGGVPPSKRLNSQSSPSKEKSVDSRDSSELNNKMEI